MKQTRILKGVVVAAILVGAVFLFARQGPKNIDPTPAPSWALRDLAGEMVESSDFDGKVVVLNFWATWCPPCRMEIPGFIDLQKEYEEEGLVIIGVSLDEAGPDVVAEFSESMGINYPIVMADMRITGAYGGIRVLPTTYIIDREGNIRNTHVGYLRRGPLEKVIKPLL